MKRAASGLLDRLDQGRAHRLLAERPGQEKIVELLTLDLLAAHVGDLFEHEHRIRLDEDRPPVRRWLRGDDVGLATEFDMDVPRPHRGSRVYVHPGSAGGGLS